MKRERSTKPEEYRRNYFAMRLTDSEMEKLQAMAKFYGPSTTLSDLARYLIFNSPDFLLFRFDTTNERGSSPRKAGKSENATT